MVLMFWLFSARNFHGSHCSERVPRQIWNFSWENILAVQESSWIPWIFFPPLKFARIIYAFCFNLYLMFWIYLFKGQGNKFIISVHRNLSAYNINNSIFVSYTFCFCKEISFLKVFINTFYNFCMVLYNIKYLLQ